MFPWTKGLLPGACALGVTACAAAAVSAPSGAPAEAAPGAASARVSPDAALAVPGAPPVGTLEWRFNAGSTVPAAPAIGPDGTVYVGTGEGTVQAVAPDGSLRWAYTVEGAVAASPVIDPDGRVVVATSAARLYAFWPTGERAWGLRLRAHLATELVPAPALGGTLLGVTDGGLWAFSAQGTALWHTDVGAPLSSVLGAAGRHVVVATHSGDAAVFEGAVRRATAALGAAPRGAPVVCGDGSAVLLAGSALVRLSASGRVEWRREGVAWLGGEEGALYAIDTAPGSGVLVRLAGDGAVEREVPLPAPASGPPALGDDGVVYVSGETGELWAVRPDGAIARSRLARTALLRPVLDGPRRRVVVAAGSGALTVLEVRP